MTVLGDAQFHQKICLQVVGVPEESQPFGTKAMERIRGEDLKCPSCIARHAGPN